MIGFTSILFQELVLIMGMMIKKEGESNNNTDQNCMPSIQYLSRKGIKYEDLSIVFVLDSNQEITISSRDETTSLLPIMSAATIANADWTLYTHCWP